MKNNDKFTFPESKINQNNHKKEIDGLFLKNPIRTDNDSTK